MANQARGSHPQSLLGHSYLFCSLYTLRVLETQHTTYCCCWEREDSHTHTHTHSGSTHTPTEGPCWLTTAGTVDLSAAVEPPKAVRGEPEAPSPSSSPQDSSSEMGCSSGHIPCQPPAPGLHPDLDCSGGGRSSDGPSPPQDGEGRTDASEVVKPLQSLPTLERLAQATGGTEKSWYRCVFPFGVISLVIGVAGTGVSFTFDTTRQTKVVSVVLLAVGVVMLLMAIICWRAHRKRRRRRKEGGFFCSEQGTL